MILERRIQKLGLLEGPILNRWHWKCDLEES